MKKARTKVKNYDVVSKTMEKYNKGKLHTGSEEGPVVKSRKQALAIGYSEERKKEERSKK